MKKNLLLISFLSFICITHAFTQQMLESGNNWNLLDIFWVSGWTNNYSIGSDTIIDGTMYQQVLRDGEFMPNEDPLAPRFVRETEDGKVYMNNHLVSDMDEILIYDFGLNLMDTFTLAPSMSTSVANRFVVTEVDTIVLLNGSNRRQLRLELVDSQFNGTITWIEGVGEKEYGPFYAHVFYIFDASSNLLCAYQEDNLQVYQNPTYDSCFITTTAVEELDMNSPIKIYPNPVQDLLTLEFSAADYSFTEISIFNIQGASVYHQTNAFDIKEIDTSELTPGMYYLVLKDKSGKRYSQRLVKL